jgi:large subunit ribosomal protein L32
MANPKKKMSSSRKGNRRAHDSLKPAAISACKKCGAMKRPHYVCGKCEELVGISL